MSTNLVVRNFSRNGVPLEGTRFANLYLSVRITPTPPGEKLRGNMLLTAAKSEKKSVKKKLPRREGSNPQPSDL